MPDEIDYGRVVSELRRKRELHVGQLRALEAERASLALAAHTGDAGAAKRLSEIRRLVQDHDSIREEVVAALAAAEEHAEAQRQQRAATERARAKALAAERITRFAEQGPALDAAIAQLVDAIRAMRAEEAAIWETLSPHFSPDHLAFVLPVAPRWERALFSRLAREGVLPSDFPQMRLDPSEGHTSMTEFAAVVFDTVRNRVGIPSSVAEPAEAA